MPFSPFGPIIAELMLNFLFILPLLRKKKGFTLTGATATGNLPVSFGGFMSTSTAPELPKIQSSMEK